MCLAVPAKITEINGDMGKVEVGGVTREVSLLMCPGLSLGDYVIIHAGFALHKVEPQEAEESLKLLKELVEATGG